MARFCRAAVFAAAIVSVLPLGGSAQTDKRAALIAQATAAIREARYADAEKTLADALAMDPSMTRARLVLGQMRYRLKDLGGAIRAYEEVLAQEPQNREAAATLERWRRELELHDRMQLAVGSHFAVSFEGAAEATLAAKVIESLDRAYWRIGDLMGTYPAELVPVVLYTEEQFRDITRSPGWAAGAFDGTIRVPVRGALGSQEELDRVLAHEFAHALVRSIVPNRVPTWFDEGLATALEGPSLAWAERRLKSAQARVPLSELAGSFDSLSEAGAQTAYAESALAMRALIDEAGGYAVTNVLHDLADGVAFDEAFAHRMPRPLADFERGLSLRQP